MAAPAQSGFRISGTLVDAVSGQPLAHARVAIAPVTQRNSFTTIITREDGRFLFPSLAPGKYTLAAQARGHLLQSFNQHDRFASSIAVGPKKSSTNLLFRLSPEGAIFGVVSDEAGEAVRNAEVMLYFTGLSAGAETTRPRGRATTDDEGAYHFGHLAPGRYLVAVSARPWYARYPSTQADAAKFIIPAKGPIGSANGPIVLTVDNTVRSTIDHASGVARPISQQSNPQLDVAYPITFYSGATDAAAATPIVLGIGDKFEADISLQPVPALHVRLRTGRGDSQPGKFFVLERRVLDGPPIQIPTEVRDEGQGVQEIVGIPAGHYTMKAYTQGKGGPGEWTPSHEIDINDQGEIDQDQGGAYVPVTATLQFDSGIPARQAWLRLVNRKSRQVYAQPLNSKGKFAFKQGVPAGSYEVTIANSPGAYLKSISAAGARVSGRTIEVRPGRPVQLAIRAARGEGEISGTALRDGKPLAGAMIVLVPADPKHNQVLFRRDQSDSDGTFTLSHVVPGAYTVVAIENGWKLEWMKPEVLKNYLPGGTPVRAQPKGKYNVKVAVQ